MPDKLLDKQVQLRRVSERVWKYTDSLYSDIENVMNKGLLSGTSAYDLSKELTQYLNEPDLYTQRQISRKLNLGEITPQQAQILRDKLLLSYGQGIFKNSQKNAFRLAATEINMAYHERDFNNRQKLPFVVGIEVQLSGQHPRPDMCNDLAGKYPPDFKFIGWHPRCLCHSISILASEVEMKKFYKENFTDFFKIKDIPESSKAWLKENGSKIKNYKTEPFWITENKKNFNLL